jgi:DNA-binding HxlR family transcriptional regulator
MPVPEALRYDPDPCSIARTLELVGEKWSLLVLREVFSGVRRFDDLRRRTGAPRQVLSARLTTLVDAGVLRRHPYQEPGQRTRDEYRLTAAGMDLYPVLVSLMRWGDEYLDQPTGGPSLELTHKDCGEPVDVVLRCRGAPMRRRRSSNRRTPENTSRSTSSDHFSPTSSSVRAIEQGSGSQRITSGTAMPPRLSSLDRLSKHRPG